MNHLRSITTVARAALLSAHTVLSAAFALSLYLTLSDDRTGGLSQCTPHCAGDSAFGLLTLNLFAFVVVEAAGRGRSRMRACIGGGLIAFFALLCGYHAKVGTSLDFGVVADNFGEARSIPSLRVIFASVKWKVALPIAGFGLAHLILGWRRPHRVCATPQWRGRVAWICAALAYASIVLRPIDTLDDATYFVESAFSSPYSKAPQPPPRQAGGYPLWHDGMPLTDPSAIGLEGGNRATPNVLIVAVESFDAGFVGATTADGREITPVFNSLVPRGVYVERFYANSMQTCKGHFAILFSLLPSLRGKAYRQFSDVRCLSLAEMLQRRGYETLYFQGNADLDFDGTRAYLSRNGFAAIRRADDELTPEERRASWGWGPEDRKVYQAFFRYADRKALFEPGARPVFAMISTIANHMRFDEVPPTERQLYPQPQSIRQAYANSLRLSDEHLGVLIDELERRSLLDDTIVVLTSDHAFPLGDHGITHSEASLYEEAYRIPLLMLWQAHLQPRRIARGAFSQVDVAPTILDLLRIGNAANDFVGRSVFAAADDRSAFLIQPYGGRHLGLVRPPYKYVLHLRDGGEWLFDLDSDPQEAHNLADLPDSTDAALLEAMRGRLSRVMLGQKLLETAEICPEPWALGADADSPAPPPGGAERPR